MNNGLSFKYQVEFQMLFIQYLFRKKELLLCIIKKQLYKKRVSIETRSWNEIVK